MAEQDYTAYSTEDHKTWSILYERQMVRLNGRVHPEYLRGLRAIGITADGVPQFRSLNENLSALTGWQVSAVDGQLSTEDFYAMIEHQSLPSTTEIRSREELDHSKRPDIFHDVFGHIPLLANDPYRTFQCELARLGMQHLDDVETMVRLGRAYKWLIEYGLIETPEGTRVFGAGLISSSKELDHVFSDRIVKIPFTAAAVMETPHVPASLQEHYFVIQSFGELVDSIPTFREMTA